MTYSMYSAEIKARLSNTEKQLYDINAESVAEEVRPVLLDTVKFLDTFAKEKNLGKFHLGIEDILARQTHNVGDLKHIHSTIELMDRILELTYKKDDEGESSESVAPLEIVLEDVTKGLRSIEEEVRSDKVEYLLENLSILAKRMYLGYKKEFGFSLEMKFFLEHIKLIDDDVSNSLIVTYEMYLKCLEVVAEDYKNKGIRNAELLRIRDNAESRLEAKLAENNKSLEDAVVFGEIESKPKSENDRKKRKEELMKKIESLQSELVETTKEFHDLVKEMEE